MTDHQELLHQEWKVTDEMGMRGKDSHSKEGDVFVFNCDFETFKIRIPRKEFQGPSSSYEILNNNGVKIDLLADVPEDWTVEVNQYPFGSTNPEGKKVTASRPITKGRLVSGMHEIQHAVHRGSLTEEESRELDNAREAFKNNKATEEQRILVLKEEEKAWEGVREKIKNTEKILEIKIIEDWESFDSLVKRRLSDYKNRTEG